MDMRLGIAAENNWLKEVESRIDKIRDYGEGLREGRTFRYSFSFLYFVKGEHPDHLSAPIDATCAHCGKKQIWLMPPAGKASLVGCGTILLSCLLVLLSLVLFAGSENLKIVFGGGVVFVFGCYVLGWVLSRRILKKNISKIAAEPNDPDKLPVYDLESLKSQHEL